MRSDNKSLEACFDDGAGNIFAVKSSIQYGMGENPMEQNVTIKIPGDWMEGLPREELALQQIFRLGVARYKFERAIELYRDGVGSLGYIAEVTSN